MDKENNFPCEKSELPKVDDITLWEDLVNNVGDFVYMGGAKVDSFPLPQRSQSILRGVPNITDPTSPAPVRLCTFRQVDQDAQTIEPPFPGPITSNGFLLTLSNNALKYRVRWEILSSRPTKIGFYTSDEFQLGVLNKLYLICGNKGPSLFSESIGSFIFSGNVNMYVAVNRAVEVLLKVDVIIPKFYFFPTLTPENEYVKYIITGDKCKEDRIPLYISFLTGETPYSARTIPGREFRTLYKQMIQYLEQTSLNLTLFEFPQVPLLAAPITVANNSVPTFYVEKFLDPYFVSDTTKLQPETGRKGSTLYTDNRFRYICFVIEGNSEENKINPVVEYNITIQNFTEYEREYRLVLTHWTSNAWEQMANVDRITGEYTGKLCTITGIVPGLDSVHLNSYFILDRQATEFNVAVHIKDKANVILRNIEIKYVKLPYIPPP